MPDFSFLLLYVQDPAASAAFYHGLLGLPIVDQKEDFAMLPLRDGVMLGLWSTKDVKPKGTGQTGASEVAFTASDAAAVQSLHDDWKGRGMTILQPPTQMNFGATFVAQDPDGHRLRVFAPPA